MLGLNLENTTSDDFRMTLTARYLAYDIVGSGSELRVDGTLGSDPGLGVRALQADRPDARCSWLRTPGLPTAPST